MILAVLAFLCVQAPLLEVVWDASTAKPGKLIVIDVTTPPAVAVVSQLSARLGDHAGIALPISSDHRRWRVLVPVDIESKLKPLPLQIDAILADGRTSTWNKPVALREGDYDRRTISVGKEFTQPSARQKKRAAAETLVLASALRMQSPERLWRGSFTKPTAGLQTSPFGSLRTYNKSRRSRHLGWDLDGDVGAPIVAAGRGRVLLATPRFYSGGTVLLDHGQGLMTLYFHMARIDVLAGRLVEKGEALGAVGASGQVTGPHLHFSVRLGGLYVDGRQLIELNLSADADDRNAAGPPATTPHTTSAVTPRAP